MQRLNDIQVVRLVLQIKSIGSKVYIVQFWKLRLTLFLLILNVSIKTSFIYVEKGTFGLQGPAPIKLFKNRTETIIIKISTLQDLRRNYPSKK